MRQGISSGLQIARDFRSQFDAAAGTLTVGGKLDLRPMATSLSQGLKVAQEWRSNTLQSLGGLSIHGVATNGLKSGLDAARNEVDRFSTDAARKLAGTAAGLGTSGKTLEMGTAGLTPMASVKVKPEVKLDEQHAEMSLRGWMKDLSQYYGKKSTLALGVKLLAGGGAIAGVAFAGRELAASTEGLLALQKAAADADKGIGNFYHTLGGSLPLLSGFYQAIYNGVRLLNGSGLQDARLDEQAKIADNNREIRVQAMQERKLAARESQDYIRSMTQQMQILGLSGYPAERMQSSHELENRNREIFRRSIQPAEDRLKMNELQQKLALLGGPATDNEILSQIKMLRGWSSWLQTKGEERTMIDQIRNNKTQGLGAYFSANEKTDILSRIAADRANSRGGFAMALQELQNKQYGAQGNAVRETFVSNVLGLAEQANIFREKWKAALSDWFNFGAQKAAEFKGVVGTVNDRLRFFGLNEFEALNLNIEATAPSLKAERFEKSKVENLRAKQAARDIEDITKDRLQIGMSLGEKQADDMLRSRKYNAAEMKEARLELDKRDATRLLSELESPQEKLDRDLRRYAGWYRSGAISKDQGTMLATAAGNQLLAAMPQTRQWEANAVGYVGQTVQKEQENPALQLWQEMLAAQKTTAEATAKIAAKEDAKPEVVTIP